MKISSNISETVQYQFEVFCKRVIQNEARDCFRELKRLQNKTISLSELTEKEPNKLSITEEYEEDYCVFIIRGYEIGVKSPLIGKAIKQLTERKREIILLSFFMEMTDTEIAQELGLVQSTMHYHKAKSLEEIKRLLKGQVDESKE